MREERGRVAQPTDRAPVEEGGSDVTSRVGVERRRRDGDARGTPRLSKRRSDKKDTMKGRMRALLAASPASVPASKESTQVCEREAMGARGEKENDRTSIRAAPRRNRDWPHEDVLGVGGGGRTHTIGRGKERAEHARKKKGVGAGMMHPSSTRHEVRARREEMKKTKTETQERAQTAGATLVLHFTVRGKGFVEVLLSSCSFRDRAPSRGHWCSPCA